jgi:hypothetical protein
MLRFFFCSLNDTALLVADSTNGTYGAYIALSSMPATGRLKDDPNSPSRDCHPKRRNPHQQPESGFGRRDTSSCHVPLDDCCGFISSLRILISGVPRKSSPKLPERAERAENPHIRSDFGDKKITMCKHIRFEQENQRPDDCCRHQVGSREQ